MHKAYEVFSTATGATQGFYRTEREAEEACNAGQDYEEVKGEWFDCYNDYSVQEFFRKA